MRVLVFLSSVIEGFEPFREAATRGISKAGCHPLRVEDLPSQDRSPRNACLDLVEEADVFLLVVGARGGWTAPSGKNVTEEEFEHARRRGKTTVVFLTDEERDKDAERLARKASEYVHGRFRTVVSSPQELQDQVEHALRELMPRFEAPMTDFTKVQESVLTVGNDAQETTLRLAVAPERASGDVVDVLQLEDEEFVDDLYGLLHAPAVRLFSYEAAKSASLKRDSLVIDQTSPRAQTTPVSRVRFELTVQGLLLLDVNVSGLRASDSIHQMTDHHLLVEDDVKERVQVLLRAAVAVYDFIDPHLRYDRLALNAALGGIGYRKWTQEQGPKTRYGMRMSGDDPVAAFDEPRIVTRSELKAHGDLVNRILVMLRRGVGKE